MQDYHSIQAWQRAHALAVQVRRATHAMPRQGYNDLKTQITRAADSIPTNVVEGASADTRREFARFLSISIKSCSELQYHLELAHANAVLPEHTWQYLSRETIEIRKMLFAYRGTVLRKDAEQPRERAGRGVKRGTQP